VSEGDSLLVLEAMKMENVIRAPRAGIIAEVQAQVGEAVEKSAVLLTYEMNE
jgi:3-methylcrotonyl-CoA carboxylase alpha subunit